ncbi:MAG: EamA family transporter [Polyangiales bacterium]
MLAIGVLFSGLAAGVWKHTHASVGAFCLLFPLGKALAAMAWPRSRAFFAARGAFLRASMLAALANGLAWVAYLHAFERGPLALVQTVSSGYAAIAVVLATVFLNERFSLSKGVGVALDLAAGSLLSFASGKGGAAQSGWLAASFASAALWGIGAVLCKRAHELPGADDHGFFVAHAIGLFVTVLPYGLAVGGPLHLDAGALAVVSLYVVGDVSLYAAMARGPAFVVNPLAGLYPIPSIAYVALMLGELPDRLGWLAMALVLPGVGLATRSEED